MPVSCAAPDCSTALERAHRIENPRRLRAQILGARFRARKMRAIDDAHVDAGARERERDRRTGRTTANDEHLRIEHSRTLPRQERGQKAARALLRKFTMSLSSHGTPRSGAFVAPQSCSVAFGLTVAGVAPPTRLHRRAEQRVDDRARDAADRDVAAPPRASIPVARSTQRDEHGAGDRRQCANQPRRPRTFPRERAAR